MCELLHTAKHYLPVSTFEFVLERISLRAYVAITPRLRIFTLTLMVAQKLIKPHAYEDVHLKLFTCAGNKWR